MKADLHARAISKRYTSWMALNHMSLTVSSAEAVGIIGPNGSGKSTLLSILARTTDPDSGTLLYRDDNLLARRASDLVRLGISRLFQLPRLCNELAAIENVGIANAVRGRLGSIARLASRKAISTESARCQLDFVGFPADKESVIAANLTHFERRLVEFARAIEQKPNLFLLDEPTSGLTDTETEHICLLLEGLRAKGIALVLVEHKSRVVERCCDRIIEMAAGEISLQQTTARV